MKTIKNTIDTLRTKANVAIIARPVILVYIALASILGMIIVNTAAIDSNVLKALLTVGLIFLAAGCLLAYGADLLAEFLGKDHSVEELLELPEDDPKDARIVD